jgi:hypothetical protein
VVLSYHAVDWAKKSNGKYFHPEFELWIFPKVSQDVLVLGEEETSWRMWEETNEKE